MKRPRATGIMAWAGASPYRWLLAAVMAIPLLGAPAAAQQSSAEADGELPGKAMRQIEELLAAKEQRTPAQRKVLSQLLEAARHQSEPSVSARQQAAETDPVANPDPVTVDIRADVTPAVLAHIRALGGAIVNSVPRYRSIRARLPLSALEPLATLEAVQFIRPADQPIVQGALEPSAVARATVMTDKVDTTEGDVAHQVNTARQTYTVDGTGIGIGVISDGVDTLADQQATGDVPGQVFVLPGQQGGSFPLACGGRTSGSEGTAMLEIVHDLAPGAELYFADGGGGRAQMAQNIENLCAGGADVIVDDIGYLTASAFQDDVIAQAISAAAANGCFYFSSAGNGGNLNDGTAGVWEGDFASGGTLSVNGVTVGDVHDFGGGETGNTIQTSSTRPIILQWADPVDGSANDYDLFLIDNDDNVLASSTNTQDGTQDPVEYIGGSCSGDYKDARLVIVKTTGAGDRYVRLNYARGALEFSTAGQTFGHSASQDAIGVAAVDVDDAGGAGGVFDGTESVETFSSDGLRRIFFEADGTPITAGNFSSTGGRVLQKPDLAAADGVSTSTPGFSTFHGTSAAAPHAAAIAALMLEAAGGPGEVTLANLRAGMTGAALDIEATGVDRDSGAGIVMAPGAVDAVDVAKADRNAAPTVTGTLTAGTMAPGGAAVTIDVSGAFDDSDDTTLTYTALSADPDRVETAVTGSMLTLTPTAPGIVTVAVRAVDPHGLSVTLTFAVTIAVGTRDYDADNNDLIDVANLEQLDAMRYDLDGDGMVDDLSDWQSYYASGAFEQGAIDMGCPVGCTGYELTADLDFDTNGSGGPDSGDDYWNGGDGWAPIGGDGTQSSGNQLLLRNPFSAIFEGNGQTIGNLFIDTDTTVLAGLFGYTTSEIRNVGLIDVDVTGTGLTAGLAAFNVGEIRTSFVAGRVSGVDNTGGLVGINWAEGGIRGSYAATAVSGDDDVGGLVGDNRGVITATYAAGSVSGDSDVGGLVGNNKSTGEISASYSTGPVSGDSDVGGFVGQDEGGSIAASYWDTRTSGRTTSAVGRARTTAQLQAPTGYAGIYGSWNRDLDGDNAADDPWDFGTSSQYPVLSVDFDGNGDTTWQEFGYQLREGPTLTATENPTEIELSWTAVTVSHWTMAPPDVTYTVTRDDGTNFDTLAENLNGLTFTDTNVTAGVTYNYQVTALVAGGEAARSAFGEAPVMPPPPPPPPPVTGGGGGGGGGGAARERPPSYPGAIQAEGGDGAITLTWDAPFSQGSSRIEHYEYRIDGEGEWISTLSSDRIHTITGLINGRVYFFHLRAVSADGAGSHRISPETTPVADLDFTHFTNGGFVTSTLALVNAGAYPVRPAIYFYDQDGDPIAARRVVEITPDLEVDDDGALRPLTVMNPLGELTIASHGRGGQRAGSVTVRAPGSIGGVLRFDIPGFGVAGVADSPTVRDALLPVRRQAMGINTGVAIRNRGTSTLTVGCRLMRNGAVLEEADIRLAANGQDARFIDAIFPAADTSDFAGSVRCTAPEPGRFSAVAFELDGVHRIFTTLPVVPVPAREQEQDAAQLDFTHFANGAEIVSDLVLVNAGAEPVQPAIHFYDQDGAPIAAESLVDITEELQVDADGALIPGTSIDPLGELTISTHGRGEQVSGSVAVVADGPIGGVLRFDIPALGVAGVGHSPPLRDVLVPVRRQTDGINTGVAVHNRGEAALLVRCRLMRDGVVLEETMIPLAANGQDARFIDQVFPTADTSDFTGSVRCMTPEPGLFSAVAFELDGVHRIFTTLPVVPVVEVQ